MRDSRYGLTILIKEQDGWPGLCSPRSRCTGESYHSHKSTVSYDGRCSGAPSLRLFKGGVFALDSCALRIVTPVRSRVTLYHNI